MVQEHPLLFLFKQLFVKKKKKTYYPIFPNYNVYDLFFRGKGGVESCNVLFDNLDKLKWPPRKTDRKS